MAVDPDPEVRRGMLSWNDPDWQRQARDWVLAGLATAGLRPTGDIEHRHVRAWSVVWRVPTDAGPVWFKANGGGSTYEPALLAVLAERVPSRVLPPIAVDTDRGWSLQPDGGPTLRTVADPDERLAHWERVLPGYAELQLAVAPHVADLLAAGVPDHRPEVLPELLDRLLADREWLLVGQPDGLDPATLDRLRALLPEYADRCRRLAASGVAASVQHDDLHDGNVLPGPDGHRFFDWGDACVGHPFGSMLVTLGSVAHRAGWAVDDPRLRRLRDAYLEPFAGDRRELADCLDLAVSVARVGRALSWQRALCGAGPDERGEHAGAVPGWLATLLDRA